MSGTTEVIEECVEVHHVIPESAYRYIIETILGRPRQRYKGSAHYTFDRLFPEQADQVTAYLRTLAITHDRETTVRWEA